MATVKTNEIKKGTIFNLRNGWKAKMEDNMRGNTRLATVFGDYTEMGSVYSHDIVEALIDGHWTPVEHTPAQQKLRAQVARMGF